MSFAIFIVCMFFSSRPLTAEDIAQRRELLRQKQQDKTTTNEESNNGTVENSNTTTSEATVSTTQPQSDSNENLDENLFLAFARVYSGRLKPGQKIFVLSPRHDPASFVGVVRLHIIVRFHQKMFFFSF